MTRRERVEPVTRRGTVYAVYTKGFEMYDETDETPKLWCVPFSVASRVVVTSEVMNDGIIRRNRLAKGDEVEVSVPRYLAVKVGLIPDEQESRN